MKTGERRLELDGVRGVAILLVLIGHAYESLAPLAAAGVTLFFTLSGFLITSLLLTEHEQRGRIRLRHFYMRRMTRLAPPLLAMLVIAWPLLDLSWRQVLASATWVGNYAQLAGVNMGALGHTWSLAVEEQFYLLFPLALIGLLRLRRPVLWLAVALFALMVWKVAQIAGGQVAYSYYALETAGVAIVAGCLVALAQCRLAGSRAAVALALTFVVLPLGANGWLVTPLLVTPMAATLVAAASGARWLAWRPLAFCGVASYSIYLWHCPVSYLVDGGYTPLGVTLGAIVGVFAYFVIEAPLMRRRASEPRVRPERAGQTVAPVASTQPVPLNQTGFPSVVSNTCAPAVTPVGRVAVETALS